MRGDHLVMMRASLRGSNGFARETGVVCAWFGW